MENFALSQNSRSKLQTCEYKLINIVEVAILYTPIDFSVIYGHRGEVEQNRAFDEGHSSVLFPNSDHNVFPSKAVDLAPYPVDWDDEIGFSLIAGVMFFAANLLKTELKWGGRWEKLHDLGHFYLL